MLLLPSMLTSRDNVGDRALNVQRSAMIRIAHLSDPHVNQRFHPTHLGRLKKVLRHALEVEKVDHIALTGDVTSNADRRDLDACRKLFEELGILRADMLSLVIGNHDIFGGPHLAEDLLAFPSRCSNRAYATHVREFYDTFAETFVGSDGPLKSPFPYAKVLGNVALIGLNSVAHHSSIKNPVGSNGAIADAELKEFVEILKTREIKEVDHRIVMLHHHLFRRKDEHDLHTPPDTNRIVERIEQATLKLRGKRKLLKILREGDVNLVLHGHVHFTASYVRKGIECLNGGGAVYPVNSREELKYNLITIEDDQLRYETVEVSGKKPLPKSSATLDQSKHRNPVVNRVEVERKDFELVEA